MRMQSAPSLLPAGRGLGETTIARAATPDARTLLDLMVDGFYMLFLLKNRYSAADADGFRTRVRDFLAQVDRGGKRIEASSEDLYLAKYAYCALMDEMVLSTQGALAETWQRNPLQLEMFGGQTAGEQFFERLEELRAQGAARVQVLEVFHMCLLMGFQGKYFIEGSEKLGYLTARLGRRDRRPQGPARRLRTARAGTRPRQPQAARRGAAVGHRQRAGAGHAAGVPGPALDPRTPDAQ